MPVTKAAEAEAKRKAAEEQLRRAEMEQDIGAQVDAEAEAKAADKMATEAARPVKVSVPSASGVGRTVAERTIKTAVIQNPLQVFMALRRDPMVLDALHRAANAHVRAKDYDHDKAPLPGIDLDVRKEM